MRHRQDMKCKIRRTSYVLQTFSE